MNKTSFRFLPVVAFILALGTFAPSGRAQSTSTMTTVAAVPEGAPLYVDGQMYLQAMSAFWPVGSQHTLWAPSGAGFAYNTDRTIMWTFQGWTWSGGSMAGNPITVVANPAISYYHANFSTQYLLQVQICCGGAGSGAPGTIVIGGQSFSADQSLWYDANSSVTLQAFANPGWIFVGWQTAANQTATGFQNVVTVSQPVTAVALFVPAVSVTLHTSPVEMSLYADRALVPAPSVLPWGEGTTHTVGSISQQTDGQGNLWVFDHWSDGGAATHSYVVGNNTSPESVTAYYVPSIHVTFMTNPLHLNLVVDGLTLPPPYSYIYGAGQPHQVTAPLQQTDSQGIVWAFSSWDDGVTTATRTVTPTVNDQLYGIRETAVYTSQATLNIGSTISGQVVTVDGTSCTTPCSVVRAPGTQVHVSAPASVAVSDGSRQDLLGWSVGSAAPVAGDWVGTLNSSSTSITATYHLMNRLSTAANPAGSAAWTIAPASSDTFYDSQTLVSLAVSAQPGFRFSGWSGDLSGSVPSGSLMMNAPHAVVAAFNPVPYIAPTGVLNGVGTTPQTGLAPGSIASIFGASLASSTATGPASPLAQTLAGATVWIGSRLMPLYYVSPTQINLQLPADLSLGSQTVTVKSQGLADVSATFTLVRNAPGIFPLPLNGQSYALVLHQDGSLVTPDAPAIKGELLSIYTTGLGPTNPVRLEGMALPSSPVYQVLDPVTVTVGNSQFTPVSVFAAPGQVGIDLVQFRVDDSVQSGTTPSLHVTANGVDSNTLPFPVQ